MDEPFLTLADKMAGVKCLWGPNACKPEGCTRGCYDHVAEYIAVCREHFAGVAESMEDCDDYGNHSGSWNAACGAIEARIRSEGEK